MSELSPLPFNSYTPTAQESELGFLKKLAKQGMMIAPIAVIPAQIEEHFYQLNNLPTQINRIFEGVNLTDPDEDDIEELAPEAQALLKTHFLLDETIDLIYGALEPLPPRLMVRREFEGGYEAIRGRPALMSIKKLWEDAWTFDNLMDRLEQTASLALEARPVLIHDADVEESSELSQEVSSFLGKDVTVYKSDEGICCLKIIKASE